MSELKPCPFCGGDAHQVVAPFGFAVSCKECDAQSNYRDSAASAVEDWNRRAQPEANADAKDAITDTERLNFVLENGVPMMRGGEYRFHGFPGKWFKTDREAIDVAVNAARQAKESGK